MQNQKENLFLHDEQLKTPAHDEMVLWCLNKENLKTLFPDLDPGACKVSSEVPIVKVSWYGNTTTAFNESIVGYWDIKLTMHNEKAFIEIKPTIQSFGDTLRQIRSYAQNDCVKLSQVYLLTKDHRFDEEFENNGIGVLEFPEGYRDARVRHGYAL